MTWVKIPFSTYGHRGRKVWLYLRILSLGLLSEPLRFDEMFSPGQLSKGAVFSPLLAYLDMVCIFLFFIFFMGL